MRQVHRVSSYGGYRPGAGSYHGSGRALDIMVSGDYGWDIANWARANAKSLGIIEVIYQQKIWTTQRSGDGWRGCPTGAAPPPTTTTTCTSASAEPAPHTGAGLTGSPAGPHLRLGP
ncbi:hypothetical protein G7085_13940 [Tessaracoccus sp. HDW20]|uniref:hypothetical protein n=1 Tax=Tessaracoccus coleopterorum TaxID=2714950 RepID=UPI001E4113E4|nr:hypothetical protein [Tessaracoccus coleopterorum]NHB85349.1 hypothetical protein [Tessaracoccus coleopterorum]